MIPAVAPSENPNDFKNFDAIAKLSPVGHGSGSGLGLPPHSGIGYLELFSNWKIHYKVEKIV